MSLTCLPISKIKIVLPNVHSMTKIIYDQVTHRFGNKMCFIFYQRHISHIFFTLLLFCPEKEILVDFAAHLRNKSRTISKSLSLSEAPALGQVAWLLAVIHNCGLIHTEALQPNPAKPTTCWKGQTTTTGQSGAYRPIRLYARAYLKWPENFEFLSNCFYFLTFYLYTTKISWWQHHFD